MTIEDLKVSDKVCWNSRQGKVTGFVKKKTYGFNGHTDAPSARVARQPAVAGRKCQFWKGGRA